MGSLDRYIFKTAFVPMSISLLVAALLLLLEQMLRLLDFVINENGPVDVVWRMLAFLLPHYLGLALPISLFLGGVLAYRRLSLSSELEAMQATGMSQWRLMRPLYLMAIGMMTVNFTLLAYVQPYAEYGYHQLRYELQAGLLGARIPVGKFVALSKDVRLRIGEAHHGGALLGDVFVAYRDKSGNRSTFTAERGQFLKGGDPDTLVLRLSHGRQMLEHPGQNRPGVLTFDLQDFVIDLPRVAAFRTRGDDTAEATIGELIRALNEPEATRPQSYSAYRADFHFRLVHTLTFLGLPFLAAALGTTNRRKPSGAGPALGIGLIVLYHELLEEWATAGVAHGHLSPWASTWPLFLGFTLLALRLFYGMAERPGHNALRYIDAAWGLLRDGARRLIGLMKARAA